MSTNFRICYSSLVTTPTPTFFYFVSYLHKPTVSAAAAESRL